MTEWRDVDPVPDGAPAATSGKPVSAPRSSSRHAARRAPKRSVPRRQVLVLAAAGLLLVTTAVLALVVLLGGSDGPAEGSPEAITDGVASALRAGSSASLGELSCDTARARVVRDAAATLTARPAARRNGSVSVSGAVGVARVALGTRGTATLGLTRVDGQWCVAAFAASGS